MNAKQLFGKVMTFLVTIVSVLVLINMEPMTIFKNNPISGVQGYVSGEDWTKFSWYGDNNTSDFAKSFFEALEGSEFELGTDHSYWIDFRYYKGVWQNDLSCFQAYRLVVLDGQTKFIERTKEVKVIFYPWKIEKVVGTYYNLFWKTNTHEMTLVLEFPVQETEERCRNLPDGNYINMFIQTQIY